MDETENPRFRTLHESYTRAVSTLENPQNLPTCSTEMAAQRARVLLGCYRKGEAEDPETYAAGVGAILSRYPTGVAYRVTDPRTGVPGKIKFLPTIAEVKEACEAEMAPLRREEDRERRRAETRYHLSEPQVRRVSAERWKILRDELSPPKQVAYRPVEEIVAAFAARPLILSPELVEDIAKRNAEIVEEAE